MVYRVALKEGGSVYVYLLFEHKSHPEPQVALYLLSCMVQLWNQRLKQNLKPLFGMCRPAAVMWRRTTSYGR